MNEKKYKQHLVIWIVITIVLVGAAFYAGEKHGEKTMRAAGTALRGQFAGSAGRTGASRFAGGGAVMGSVIAKDDTSITVKGRDGSSKIVLYSGTTQVLKTASGSAGDVSVGTQVSITGTQNSDGSVTAQSIQIRPNMPAQGANPAPGAVQ